MTDAETYLLWGTAVVALGGFGLAAYATSVAREANS